MSSLENFQFPNYFPLDESLLRKFEIISTSDNQMIQMVDKSIQNIVESTKKYIEFILSKERMGKVTIDETLLNDNVKALREFLKSKYQLNILNDSIKESRAKIRQDLRQEQPLTFDTLQYYKDNGNGKKNIADTLISDHKESIQLHSSQNSFTSFLRGSKEYQYVKNVAFVLLHPEESLPDDVADDELAIEGGRVSLKDPISLQYFETPVKSRRCNHVYEESNILARLGDGQNSCPIDGCIAQVQRKDLEIDELMILRVKVYFAVQQQTKNLDRI